jgi:hypothetical protein
VSTRITALLRNLFDPRRRDDALDEELRAATAILADELRAHGVEDHEARRQALIELGGLDQVKERVRDIRSGRWLLDTVQDVRFGARLLRRTPGFMLVAAATLALGIGATTTVFSWAWTTLVEPLPGVVDQHRLVVVALRDRTGHLGKTVSYPDFLAYSSGSTALAALSASAQIRVRLAFGSSAEPVLGALVSANYFEVLGVRPALGRLFLPEETAGRGDSAAVIVSDALWRRKFSADPSIVGQMVHLDGAPFTVVGVTPPGFMGDFPGFGLSFWTPLSQQPKLMSSVAVANRGDR